MTEGDHYEECQHWPLECSSASGTNRGGGSREKLPLMSGPEIWKN